MAAQVLCEKGKLVEAERYALEALQLRANGLDLERINAYATLADIFRKHGSL